MKLVILPLDSRPCTREFPAQLAQSAGISAFVPPLEVMDWYRTPSDFCRIAAWLEEACAGAGALICSLDQLAYGGLLASRCMEVPETQALRRAAFLRRLKQKYPALDIYLSSVIMRTTVSTLKQEDQVWWEKVALYSQLAAQPGCEAARRLAQLEAQIPSHVLQTFLAARGRNHQVNREAVALLAEGIVKQVCFLQEDSAPQGMHRAEQQQLQALAEAQGVSEQVSIHCGTDECACALVGCLAAQRQAGGPALRLYVEWLAGDMQFTARYEDRPFAENLDAYLKTCRIMRVQSPKDAQAVLAVYAPSGPQMDLAMAPEDAVCAYTPGQLGNIAERLQALMDTGLPTGLLDVYHANGGESSLLRLAAQNGLLARLAAYAGWNTACNSLGTILGQLLAAGTGASPAALAAFTQERLLDDWVYQAIVRPRWNRELRAAGTDIWVLQDVPGANARLQQLMELTPETRLVCSRPFRAQLCWPRTFEASITICKEGESV